MVFLLSSTFRYLADENDDSDDDLSWVATDSPLSYITSDNSTNDSSQYSNSTSSSTFLWWNLSEKAENSNLDAAKDVSVEALVTSIYFNSVVFVLLMIFYECLRRTIPSVYSSRKRMHHMQPLNQNYSDGDNNNNNNINNNKYNTRSSVPPVVTYFGGDKRYYDEEENNNDYDDDDNDDNHRTSPTTKGYVGATLSAAYTEMSDNYQSCTKLKDENLHKLEESEKTSLPDSRPLDWIQPVLGVPWAKVLQSAGLDGYFFLRYIRMCVRITAVSTFWFFLVLVPIYAGGGNTERSVTGWYHLSVENIPRTGWRMWTACIFLYLFSFFIFFVVKQEYRHFLEVRQDFLAKGTAHVHPQHHYSLLVESIPYELRSDRALAEYFNVLFPGKVHSASVVLKLPDLERTSARCLRSCRRLEKSIALLHATGKRPTHCVGRGRVNLLGIEMLPLDCNIRSSFCGDDGDDTDDDSVIDEMAVIAEESGGDGACAPIVASVATAENKLLATSSMVSSKPKTEKPKRGTRVDSISYYTQELAMHSRALFRMQGRKVEIAESGNGSIRASDNWFDSAVREATVLANQILDESAIDNALTTPSDAQFVASEHFIAEHMTSRYGSISHSTLLFDNHNNRSQTNNVQPTAKTVMESDGNNNVEDDKDSVSSKNNDLSSKNGDRDDDDDDDCIKTPKDPRRLLRLQQVLRKNKGGSDDGLFASTESDRRKHLIDKYLMDGASEEANKQTPFGSQQYTSAIRRVMGRLGLDFLISITKFTQGQLDFALEGVIAETMSSTGMITFRDLSSVACAASAPLTVKASVLNVSVAPEPREIIWENAHVSRKTQMHRESIANCVLLLGVVLWSFPLTFIQAVAKLEFLAQLPGMEWLEDYTGGQFSKFVNGYLPVVALLGLIMILPVIFEYVAVKYEHRKTLSDVQASMLERYFNFQLVNIYVTVTAGSLLVIVAEIANHPINILQMGESLPRMAGYFVALLVTKILAGLPMIFLRFGALMRMLFLKLLANEKKLTQREVDAVYRLENVQYGWEFPTQLLVVVIVFTYAIMCPVILPVGLIYFMGALTVYKKQILYVYSPVYESGGALFPLAVQRTLFGLVCSQVTFLGYIVTHGCRNQSIFLAPLPVLTVMTSNYFLRTYAEPSKRLSLERARAFDRAAGPDGGNDAGKEKFDKNFYRQPVLTEVFREPWTYRRGIRDEETTRVREELRRMNRYITQTQMQNVLGVLKVMRSNLSVKE